MAWEYRNISPGRKPPCPVCGSTTDSMLQAPGNPSGKWKCLIARCGATYQAKWVPDPVATDLVQ